jgi:Uma2 family endonuclease
MSSLLQLPGIQHRAVPLSVEAWHHMIAKGLAPKRAELLEGVIIEKRSKSILHTRLLSRTMEALHQALTGAYWLRQEAPITMSDSEPEPDISVVAGREESYTAHPATALLVIEISVSTLQEDRAMAGLYAKAGVAEYWLFNARSRQVEVFRQPEAGQYLEHFTVPADSSLDSSSLHVSLELAELWEGLPLEG